MKKKKQTKLKEVVTAHADAKEKQCAKAHELSPNLDEPVQKSLAKRSSDEVQSTPR